MVRYLALLALAACSAMAADPTVDEVVAKYVAARGGLDKMKAIQSLKVTGKMIMLAAQTEAPLTLLIKRPGSVRIEIVVNGAKTVRASDGATAWDINPNRGPDARQAGEQEARRTRESADFDGPMVNAKQKGITLELLGKEDVDGSPAYKIKAIRQSGEMDYHWVDARSFLEVKSSSRRAIMGREMEIEAFIGNYKAVHGVMIPASMEQRMDGKPLVRIVWEIIEANAPIDDAVFKMPVQ
jgi:outer membrane lipoprotein-sorting protein